MPTKVIFISHIHEEKGLAMLLQRELENEFSGFVTIFVSSDGVSIPSGVNFLNRIESALSSCSAALFLISEKSVKRNWINFELGAVWIRSSIQIKSGGAEIPAIPFCHSGVIPSTLPQPLSNLNAINAMDPMHLESAFRSLQSAVGGRGSLKTNFSNLSQEIKKLENMYTVGSAFKALLLPIRGDIQKLVSHCHGLPPGTKFPLQLGFLDQKIIEGMRALEAGALNGKIGISIDKPGVEIGQNGAVNGAEVTINMNSSDIIANKEIIA